MERQPHRHSYTGAAHSIPGRGVTIRSGAKDSFKLVITDKAGESLVFFDMTNKPEAGLVPVDMFMENNGMISKDSGFHVGNKIVKML